MEEKLNQLRTLVAEIVDLGQAGAILSWDQQTNMPPGGAGSRANQLAYLGKLPQEKATCVPVEWVVEFTRVTTLTNQTWVEARQKSDFSIFQPHLEEIVKFRRQYATFFPEVEHPYEALLDEPPLFQYGGAF